jgi:two-component system phosphate regulon sensor histidine kinase PhoR
MRFGFRGRTFAAVTVVSTVALTIAGGLTLVSLRAQWIGALERALIAEARLAGSLVEHHLDARADGGLDAEADLVGSLTRSRVTLIDRTGRVVGDSTEPESALPGLENHASRPEVAEAMKTGVGVARRHSVTIDTDLLYAAVAVPGDRVAVVRLALPLTDVDAQVAALGRSMLAALLGALVCAVGLAWVSAALLSKRVGAIATAATRYASGDFSVPTADRGGDELGIVARALDDTARELGRRMEDLAQDRARMEAILAGMHEGVLVCNAQGRILLANDAARRLLKADNLVAGQHHLEVLRHPDVATLLAQALAGANPPGLEFSPPRDPDRTIVARAAPVAAAGTMGVVLVLHDISDLRHVDRMRRDFVANVSHELRTPLTAIQGYVEALLDDDAPGGEDAHRFLEIIDRQAKRMERLVRDLLRLARLEAGQEPVERVTVETEALFEEVTTELASAIDARQQHVTITVSDDAASLLSDPGKLHDVLRNLVENAIAYAPAGTRIDLSAARDGEAVVLAVLDQGPGIPPADVARIFERFYRVDKARSRESGGTGLGLSIVKHLVNLLGGEVKAANRADGGAAFSVRLPSA